MYKCKTINIKQFEFGSFQIEIKIRSGYLKKAATFYWKEKIIKSYN
jgi:hypothetical protein